MNIRNAISRMITHARKALYALIGLVISIVGLTQAIAEDNTLTVEKPTQNEDGTALTDLASIRFYHSVDSQGTDGPYELIGTVTHVAGEPEASYVHTGNLDGIHCYVATAVSETGQESDNSNEACKSVDTILPGTPGNLRVE